jgi:glycosyltransferase involved in cell wall biosynthesis
MPSERLLFLRALHKIYNPILAVRALEGLLEDFPKAHLTIAGPDKGDGTAQELHRSIELSELSSYVTVPGAVPKADVPSLMSQADVFVNTTNVDNTPISVIEAMASGLCIVSTDVGGIPYLLTHEHDALLVPPNDAGALAQAIKRVLTEPGLAERLSRNARLKAEQFDWNRILPMWESLLTETALKGRYAAQRGRQS